MDTLHDQADICNTKTINRLNRFLSTLDSKIVKLEALLPSNPCATSYSLSKPNLKMLRKRGRKFVNWGKSSLGSFNLISSNFQQDETSETNESPRKSIDFDEVTTLYNFLKSTTEEFKISNTKNMLVSSETDSLFDTEDSSTLASTSDSILSLKRFSKIYDEHFLKFSSSLDDNRNNELHINYYVKGKNEILSTGVIQTLDYLDEKIEILLSDPEYTSPSIKFFHWDKAYEMGQSSHLHYYQLPFPWRENRYIVHGYRFYHSHIKSFLSIFNWYGWHNETTNIWSHLLGCLYLCYLIFIHFPQSSLYQSDKVPQFAILMIQVFLVSSAKCLVSSVTWHTFNGTCYLPLRSKFACIDYTGITILITSSILTIEFVTLYQENGSSIAMKIYMFLSFILGVFGCLMNWCPKFDTPEFRSMKIIFYLLLATMGFFSFIHLTLVHSLDYSSTLFKPVFRKSCIWYLIGVGFYASFIPERWRTDIIVENLPTNTQLVKDLDIVTKHKHIYFRETPTLGDKKGLKSLWWVDYFCCSHTIWHIFVIFGIVGHYFAILEVFGEKWQI